MSAEWDRVEDDRGRPLLTLRLRDYTGEVTGHFTPRELEDYDHWRFRLYRIWGDLLQIRSHKELEELQGSRTSGE